jgi:CRP/FNR family transcriptional regulator
MPGAFQDLVQNRCRIRSGKVLFNAGDAFTAIYAIDGGLFKTNVIDAQGREQVTGFFMGGELLGLEGIGLAHHQVTAVALEDSVVGVMPYSRIEQCSRERPALQRELDVALSRQIARGQDMMMLLGQLRAEARLAAFLLSFSARLGQRGYSRAEFRLRMTRWELGSHLGLTLETVSRLLSGFRRQGLIEIRDRQVRLLDVPGLRALAGAAAR